MFPKLNESFDVKHIDHDFKKGGLEDAFVYEFAVVKGRIIVTQNNKHFKPLAGTKHDFGIIGIPPHFKPDTINAKLTAILKHHSPKYFKSKFISIGAIADPKI